jgi:hypothetical protein
MELFYRGLISSLFAIGFALAASAQDSQPDQITPSAATTSPANIPSSLTGKERLGKKWMDEQRIDNCNVPIERRGSRSRPSNCPHVPAG